MLQHWAAPPRKESKKSDQARDRAHAAGRGKPGLQWEPSIPVFSGPNLYDSNSFTSWCQDFSITNNCSIQALLSTSEPTAHKAQRTGLQAAFKAPARGKMLEDACVQTHKALPRHLGFRLDALKNGHFLLTPSVLLLGRPGGPIVLLPSSLHSPGKSSATVSTVPPALIHWGRAEEGQLGELTLCAHRL